MVSEAAMKYLITIPPEDVPPGVESPLKTLNEKQVKLMAELREETKKWPESEKQQEFLTDLMLYRFLMGLSWDLATATEQLKDAVVWRTKNRPDLFRAKQFSDIGTQNYVYHYGYGRGGHPIVYVHLGRDKLPFDDKYRDMKFNFLIYQMERCQRIMPDNIHSIIWLVDLKDASISMSLIKNMKNAFAELGNRYTESLHKVYLLNTGWFVRSIWKILTYVLHKRTVAKYNFMSGSAKHIREEISKSIDPKYLLKDFYGDSEYKFDMDSLIKAEAAYDNEVAGENATEEKEEDKEDKEDKEEETKENNETE